MQLHSVSGFYKEDKLHPTPLTSYIIALLIHQIIYDKPASTKELIFKGNPIEEAEGKVYNDSSVLLASIRREDALEFSEKVRSFCKTLDENGGYFEMEKPQSPILPRVTGRDAISNESLIGKWKGFSKLYPDYLTWPSKLDFDFSVSSDSLSVITKISFGGKPNDVISEKNPVMIYGSKLIFTTKGGPNGSAIRYTAALKENSLSGIAEFIHPTNKYFYGVGEFELTKEDK
ncbi:hypothetical protein BH10BAC4_BH10BAC4_22370 [soil metagenome]